MSKELKRHIAKINKIPTLRQRVYHANVLLAFNKVNNNEYAILIQHAYA